MADTFKTYEAAVEWLYYELPRTSKEIFKGEAGLEKMRCILEFFGNPQDDYPSVHIAGTSGKGTTAKLTSDMLSLSGKSVGTIMSPHVYDLRERFLVDGEFVEKTEVKETLEELRARFIGLAKEEVYPTYFEATLLLAYLVFENHQIDYLVVETGLGGLLDGTNLISRKDKVAVITKIGLDHTEILGDTLEKIAQQKAGIITESIDVFVLSQESTVNAVFKRIARQKQASLELVQPRALSLENTSLAGEHQAGNIALAIKAVEALAERDHWEFNQQAQAKAITEFSLPGRFETREFLGKTIILDGAHNSQKLEALVSTIKQQYPGKEFSVIFGSAKNRDWRELLEILRPIASEFVFTTYSARKSDMKRAAQDFSGIEIESLSTTVINDPKAVFDYINNSESEFWLVTGSFYVVSEIGQPLS